MEKSVLTMLLLVAIAGCASAPPPTPARTLRFELGAGKLNEECFLLSEGEQIEYRFESTAAVDFNLHTHRVRQVVTPVDVKRTRAQSGTFASPRAEAYCLTWTNAGGVPAHVSGEWKRLPR